MRPREFHDAECHDAHVRRAGCADAGERDLLRLAHNESPLGASPDAVEAASQAAGDPARYPTTAHVDLTEQLSDRWALESEQVWVTPGATGALEYLCRAALEPGDTLLAPNPGPTTYGRIARQHQGAVARYDLRVDDPDQDFGVGAQPILDAYDGERMLVISSPHDPIGATMPDSQLDALLERVDDHTLVVVDESYNDFSDAASAANRLLVGVDHDNLAVVRSFSAAYGLAGLRVGYALVPAAWGDAYASVSTPFAVSEPALRAAMAALDDQSHHQRVVETVKDGRDHVVQALQTPTFASEGNFVLCRVGDASEVTKAAREAGLAVRDCTPLGLPDCIRLTCGTESETERAVEILQQVLADRDDG